VKEWRGWKEGIFRVGRSPLQSDKKEDAASLIEKKDATDRLADKRKGRLQIQREKLWKSARLGQTRRPDHVRCADVSDTTV
jgi:hypothetical protein